VGAVAAALAVGAISVLPAQAPSSVVAVSTGGTLLPLARFDGTRWINTWPAPEDYTVPVPPIARVPQKWLGMRLPNEWTLWFTTGGSVKVRPARIVRGGGCIGSPELELTTEPTAPESLIDKVHVGLATAGTPIPVEAVRRLTDADAEWDAVAATLASAYEARRSALEVEPLRDHADAARIGALFASAQPSTAWLFASAAEHQPTAYTFEFAKQVTLEGSLIRASLSGWLVRNAEGRLVVPQTTARFEQDPEGTDVPLAVPLGIVRTGMEAVWVIEHHPGEVTKFHLVAINPAGVRTVLFIDAGGC